MRFLLLAFTILAANILYAAESPNIVFIFADDLGYADLSNYGATEINTPAIDSLGEDGIRFTDFYSASPICSPSRAALLTGRYPIRMGINGVFWPQSLDGLPPEENTLAEILKTKGYRTGIVGKWHLGHHHKHLPLQNGFDEYFGIPYSNDMEMVVYMRGNDVETQVVDQNYTTRAYTEEAISFIERHKDKSFFLLLSHSMPHVPIYASEPFRGTSELGIYGDVIHELDWSVQQILDTLKKHDIDQNTIVIFTSDNGPWLSLEHLGGSAKPLREGKMFTFDGGMKVPCLVRWPDGIPAGQLSTEMANMMDWVPTFARITGADLPADKAIDGEDISAVLAGTGKRAKDEFLYFSGKQLQAIRDGDWKLKVAYEGNEWARWRQAVAAHPISLFNLKKDPGETTNLAEQHPERVEALKAKMQAILNELGPLPPSKAFRQAADESHFEILGYDELVK